MKHSRGKWFIVYIGKIPTGVNVIIEKSEHGTYSKNIVEIILPENDKEWEKEREETTANLKLIVSAPELLKTLDWVVDQMKQHTAIRASSHKIESKCMEAIKKATE